MSQETQFPTADNLESIGSPDRLTVKEKKLSTKRHWPQLQAYCLLAQLLWVALVTSPIQICQAQQINFHRQASQNQ